MHLQLRQLHLITSNYERSGISISIGRQTSLHTDSEDGVDMQVVEAMASDLPLMLKVHEIWSVIIRKSLKLLPPDVTV